MRAGQKTASRPKWLDGLIVQRRVISALMLRSALSRFGHDNLGFFWTVGEPLALTSGIMLVWSVLKITHGGEVGVIPFALSGYTFISLWRHIVQRSVRIIRSHTNLAYHRNVKYLDVIIANATLELVSILSAFFVALLPLWLLDLCPMIRDPLPLITGYVSIAIFALGIGIVLASLSELNEVVEHLIAPVTYLTLPLTGVFAMVEWLPPPLQKVLSWSPLANSIEMIRSGLFSPEISTHYSASYLLVCCFVANGSGLLLYRHSEKHIQAS